MHPIVWRVVPLAVPAWPVRCARCGAPDLHSTGRFRVNSNGPLHDVWLIYRCPSCELSRKRSIHRRVREVAGCSLAPYRCNDPDTATHCAFALSHGAQVAYRVERPPLVFTAALDVQITARFPCGARWDAFLARELGCSRSKIVLAWCAGAVRVAPTARARAVVRDGDRLSAYLDGTGRPITPDRAPPAARASRAPGTTGRSAR